MRGCSMPRSPARNPPAESPSRPPRTPRPAPVTAPATSIAARRPPVTAKMAYLRLRHLTYRVEGRGSRVEGHRSHVERVGVQRRDAESAENALRYRSSGNSLSDALSLCVL